ncbi:CATRA system-associated protein [Paractinoplanes brasiliensis]|uniref:CATRA-Associated Small Protein domain-containing protein n=1 Tax=Paractinoplanes brasiliensis TaxID=52695 RepID=A0A4R6J9D6_9ACTN|nr:CATRA system-associated protein [Actinoplanes brasiliensis]TDO32253.1 hypothetical protein C8E87_7709 [Actinoplanes brasiliensis]GID27878.1 hypothetical protein Abr02nite_28610 [Actinoplanes brasiliensis]
MDPWDDETVQDAVAVLRDVAEWHHTPQKWAQVELAMGALDDAVGTGDAEAVRAAVGEINRLGPKRILRIGSTTATGIPAPVLDRRDTLVHRLTHSRDEGDGRGRRRSR